jgi:hypothetical protein
MKTESTILKIKQELISMFASLDAWFDKLLDDGFNPEQHAETLEIVEHIFSSNYNLLNVLPKECENSLDSLEHHLDLFPDRSFEELRSGLREQLYHSLCLIDALEESSALDTLNHDKRMELHEKLFSIAEHLRYHLELLELGEGMENR